jgi:hypothetical protein
LQLYFHDTLHVVKIIQYVRFEVVMAMTIKIIDAICPSTILNYFSSKYHIADDSDTESIITYAILVRHLLQHRSVSCLVLS